MPKAAQTFSRPVASRPLESLIHSVRRNLMRFPADFMFQLTREEAAALRLQFETSKPGRGGRRYLPYAFTELGIAMLSSVPNSERAVQMNMAIMRAFVGMREIIAHNMDIAARKKAANRLRSW